MDEMGKTGVDLQQTTSEQEEGMEEEKKGDRHPPHSPHTMKSPPTFQPWLRVWHWRCIEP